MEPRPFDEGLPDSETAFGHLVTSHVNFLVSMLHDFLPLGKASGGILKMLIPLTRNTAPWFQAPFVGKTVMMSKISRPAAAVAAPASR
jgi:hypothetical protein